MKRVEIQSNHQPAFDIQFSVNSINLTAFTSLELMHIKIAFIVIFILSVAAVVGFSTVSGGQSQRPSSTVQHVKPTAGIRESLNHQDAARRNASLSYDLNWTFGGKQQRGWYLYIPLIARLLKTDATVNSEKFAADLSDWQKKRALAPTGMLDEDTLMSMIATWQGQRLKQKDYASPDQLINVAASEFYDPSRPDELRYVERKTYDAYKKMIAAAVKDESLGLAATANGELAAGEKYLKIISAFRSREYQDKLRKQQPSVGRAGLAVNSPHFTGRALDLYVGGEPVETKDVNRAIQVQTPVYRWLVRNAERFGFRPYYYEPWHWEYVE